MDSKSYFEKAMQDFNQFRNGRSLRKYCTDEGIDYNWLMMEEDYIKKRNALLARIAHARRVYEEQNALAEKMKAKADSLERECEEKDRQIAELEARINRIKRNLGIR